ncbi:hypothetical protein FZC66_00380 [Priestia megaterium]|nr:hypothetical protein FZC66_00380 [Priestia megaterium]
MAQLIKIQDYISRYERDLYHYSSQFIQLKKQNWEQAKAAFETGELTRNEFVNDQETEEEASASFLTKVKSFFKKDKMEFIDQELLEDDKSNVEKEEETLSFFITQPQNLHDLKVLFLENVFQLQMRWATSTLFELSHIDRRFMYDGRLKYFLQSFPDTYLVMYKPVFLLKKAPVEAEIILIGPTETICISMIEGKDGSVFQYSKENFWIELVGKEKKKVLNPLLGLQRTEQIIKNLYQANNIERPVRKVILSRNGFLDYPVEPYQMEFIDKRNYDTWFYELRRLSAPLKFNQLQAAQVLLNHSQSIYFDRNENE